MIVIIALLALLQIATVWAQSPVVTQVPLPAGGRYDVHGWLILPQEQPQKDNSSYGVRAWFSHHVPEFWFDSCHNFQIILEGVLVPESSVPGEAPLPLELPLPPANNLEMYEYSFTPPSPFSLNDLLTGKIQQLKGVYYNGSFDTSYERIPMSLSLLQIESLTTVVYLSETETNGYSNLRYLSYPRNKRVSSGSKHFYLAHEIHAQPDFDHVVHGVIDKCSDSSESAMSLLYTPGISWEVIGIPNTLEYKLKADQVATINLVDDNAGTSQSCTLTVLESLHCMIGPGFMDNC